MKEWTDQGHQPPGAGVVDSGLRMHELDRVERSRALGPLHRRYALRLDGRVNRLTSGD